MKFILPLITLACLFTLSSPSFADNSAKPASTSSKLELSSALLKSGSLEARLKAMCEKQLAGQQTGEALATYLESSRAMRIRLAQWRMFAQAAATEQALTTQRDKAAADFKKTEADYKLKLATYQSTKNEALKKELLTMKENLLELRSRSQDPVNFAQLAKDAKHAARFEALSADLDWLQFMMYSGEHVPVLRAVSLFLEMADKDPSILKAGRKRDIASAIALEFASNNWPSFRALARAEFYIKNWSAGRMNKALDTLSMSQLRALMGIKGAHKAGYADNYQWCLDNAHIPASHYVGTGDVYAICWRGAYRRDNIYGDSIHVNFYETYGDAFDTYGQEICQMGAICGGLSHFGAYAAAANGLAAQTMGEPGHCAYTVLVNGKWCPAYSLSWERWLHWHPWKDAGFFSALQFSHDLYDGKNLTKTLKAMDLESAALLMQEKNPKLAKSYFQAALKQQPLNITTYRDYCALLSKEGSSEEKLNLMRTLCQSMPATAPEMAAFILQSKGMPLLAGLAPDARQAVVTDFWKSIKTIGPAPWNVSKFISTQADWVCKGAKDPAAQGLNFYSKLLSAVVAKPDFTPAIMTWGNDWALKQDAKTQAALSKETVRIITQASGKGASIAGLLRGAIISAENMGDISAFQSLMKNVPDKERYIGGMPTWEPFAGELVSKGGLISLSSTCEFDSPTHHSGVLDPRGGKFHTGKDTDAWVKVKLPHVCQLSGVVIIPTTNSTYRQHNMCIQVSATGEDGSWVDIERLGDTPPARVTRVDMSKKQPKALYVRIKRVGGPEFFHLNGIYVYGKRVS